MDTTTKSFTPNILSFLPLFYVGWSDSVLSPAEMKFIHRKIDSYDFLSDSEKDYLIRWSDPLNPPAEKEFKLWGNALREAALNFTPEKKKSLVGLGLEIAKESATLKNGVIQDAPDMEKVLTDFKEILGLNSENEKLLIGKLFPKVDKDFKDNKPSFDPIILKKILDGNCEPIRDHVRQILRDPIFAQSAEQDKEKYREIILNQVKELAKLGMSAYSFPVEYGGLDKAEDYIAVYDMLGYGDLSLAIKFGVQFGLFGGSVLQLGTKKHHEKYINKLMNAELLGCFAMTETGHGSNVKNIETTATYNHNKKELTIHSPNFSAGKEYIGNAMHSSIAAVFCQLIIDDENHGVHAVLVKLRDAKGALMPGVKIEDCGYKMGLNGVDNGRIWFDNVIVPVENLLDKFGGITEKGKYKSPISNPSKRFFVTLGALVVGRISVGLLGTNASKVALTIAIKYAFRRRQFATKSGLQESLIIDYPTHQKRLFPQLAKTYGYFFALSDLALKYAHASEHEVREVETLAAGLKAKATWHATNTIQICREACGGKGYIFENRFTRLKGDTDIFTTFEGDNTVLMQLVAKGLMTEFKQSFHNDGYRAVMRFLFTKAKHDVYELNPIFGRNTNASHLLDPDFHFHAFNYRQRKTLITLSERMQKYIKRGTGADQAFLRVQNHMIDLADAYIDRVVLESFYKRYDDCIDPATKKVLGSLVQLYALETINQNKGWYLESDYMEGSKTKAIRRLISKLYSEIKPEAIGLVDAFAIPDELIMAPIAFKEFS